MPAGGSCLLGSINLSAFVNSQGKFNELDFVNTVHDAVIALNEILDEGLPRHPLAIQRETVRDWRQIGLGIMGLADMLIKMGVRYGSEESIKICDHIGNLMATNAMVASATLAREHGAFPKCDVEKIMASGYYKAHSTPMLDELVKEYGLRNSQLLTIAPTGTISSMLGCSGGLEAIFANSYERKTESLHGEDVYYKVYTPIVESYMKEHGLHDEKELPDFFVTAQTIDYMERIEMQSTWQKHIDASISSTINVPNDFTKEEVYNLYYTAWKRGLKGVTIYRDGCKRSGILSTHGHNDDTEHALARGEVIDTSDGLIGLKRRLMTGCGTLHCSAFFDPQTGDLMETYISKGSTGGCLNSLTGLSRMISLSARGGLSLDKIVDQLNSCGVCPAYAVRTATKHDTSKGSCCPIAIGNALVDMHDTVMGMLEQKNNIVQDNLSIRTEGNHDQEDLAKCPECGESLIFEGGCNICKNCGWSKCG